MGLDISHNKATLERPGDLNPFNRSYKTESEFEGFDIDFHYFERFIQEIDVPEIFETIIFPLRENEINEVKEFLKSGNYRFLHCNDKTGIEKLVNDFVQENNLGNNLLHSWQTNKWIGYHIFNFRKATGFYYTQVGEQRKGMNEHFWSRFGSENTFCFTKKDDFEYAYKCVDFYWHDDTEEDVKLRKKLFKENFIDNYELNRSWMNLSY